MPTKFKVSFDAPAVGADGRYSRKERTTRTNEFTAKEAADDVRHLRSLGFTGIKVVPVRPSARARGHGRRIRSFPDPNASTEALEAWLSTAPTRAELRKEREG